MAALILLAMPIVSAHAADWIEPPYNPAGGSRWVIESATSTAETKPDGAERSTIFNERGEMTVDEKTTEGFRVSYIARQISVEGTSPNVPIMRLYCKMLENILVRATLDAAGKPIRIDNLDAVKAEMRTGMDHLVKFAGNNERQLRSIGMMMSDLDALDAEDAAPFLLDEMVTLAKSQNTGMKTGEVRRRTDPADNPLGPTLQSKTSFTLSDTDAEKRTATYHEVRVFDDASVKEFIFAHSKAALAKSGEPVTPERLEPLMKAMTMSLDGKGIFVVENGMTREIQDTSMTMANVAGKVSTKAESKTIKVSPAP